MKIIYSIFNLLVVCCSCKQYKNILDKNDITEIKLLVADSSIFGDSKWMYNQNTGLIWDKNGNMFFVDSSGKPLHSPMQQVTFKGAEKDELIDILNTIKLNAKKSYSRTCILLLRHSLLLFSDSGKLNSKVDICFDCAEAIFSKDKSQIDFLNQHDEYKKLIKIFKIKKIYMYNATAD